MTEERRSKGISRRTVVKGAAWAVPTVPIVAAAPAYAISGAPPTITVGGACKLPGASCGNVFVKGYIFDVTITNNTGLDIYLYNQTGYEIIISETNPDLDLFFQAAVDSQGNVIAFPYLLEAGQTIAIVLNAGENGDSANQSLTGSISIPWGHTPTPPDPKNHPPAVDDFSFGDTPPYQNPACVVSLPPNCGK